MSQLPARSSGGRPAEYGVCRFGHSPILDEKTNSYIRF